MWQVVILGFYRDAAKLFQYFDVAAGGLVLIEDFRFLNLTRASSKEEPLKYSQETGEISHWNFERHITTTFTGSFVRALRVGFCRGPKALHWSETFNAEEFCDRCREIGFKGNYLSLWLELLESEKEQQALQQAADQPQRKSVHVKSKPDHAARVPQSRSMPHRRREWAQIFAEKGQRQVEFLGVVKIKDILRRDVQDVLLEFKRCCETNHVTKDQAWAALLEACVKSGEARLRRVEFLQAARLIGFHGSADVVFDALDFDLLGTISSAELDFLQIGVKERRKSRCRSSFAAEVSHAGGPSGGRLAKARPSVLLKGPVSPR